MEKAHHSSNKVIQPSHAERAVSANMKNTPFLEYSRPTVPWALQFAIKTTSWWIFGRMFSLPQKNPLVVVDKGTLQWKGNLQMERAHHSSNKVIQPPHADCPYSLSLANL